jgi:hypothetical protein
LAKQARLTKRNPTKRRNRAAATAKPKKTNLAKTKLAKKKREDHRGSTKKKKKAVTTHQFIADFTTLCECKNAKLECKYETPGTPPEWSAVKVVGIHDGDVKLLYTGCGSTEELKKSDFEPAIFRVPTLPKPKKTTLAKKMRQDQVAKRTTTLQTRIGQRTDKVAAATLGTVAEQMATQKQIIDLARMQLRTLEQQQLEQNGSVVKK